MYTYIAYHLQRCSITHPSALHTRCYVYCLRYYTCRRCSDVPCYRNMYQCTGCVTATVAAGELGQGLRELCSSRLRSTPDRDSTLCEKEMACALRPRWQALQPRRWRRQQQQATANAGGPEDSERSSRSSQQQQRRRRRQRRRRQQQQEQQHEQQHERVQVPPRGRDAGAGCGDGPGPTPGSRQTRHFRSHATCACGPSPVQPRFREALRIPRLNAAGALHSAKGGVAETR